MESWDIHRAGRCGSQYINEGDGARMSQLVFKMRQLLEYVRKEGINSDFTKALAECVRLTQGEPEVKIDEKGLLARDVKRSLDQAYKAYHTGSRRPLPYEQYEKFMQVCHGWGSFMGDVQMQRWYKETEEVYVKAGGAPPIGQTGTAALGNDDTKTRGAERMQELLVKLRELLETYEERG